MRINGTLALAPQLQDNMAPRLGMRSLKVWREGVRWVFWGYRYTESRLGASKAEQHVISGPGGSHPEVKRRSGLRRVVVFAGRHQ